MWAVNRVEPHDRDRAVLGVNEIGPVRAVAEACEVLDQMGVTVDVVEGDAAFQREPIALASEAGGVCGPQYRVDRPPRGYGPGGSLFGRRSASE